MKVKHEIFFVVGEAIMLPTLSETSWGSSSDLFQTLVSRDLSLECHSTLREDCMSLLLLWWGVVRPRSYLGRSMERHRRVVRSTLRWTFSNSSTVGFHARKNVKGASGGLRKASRAFLAHRIERWKNIEKFTEECFAQHVDGAPSTASSRLLNWDHAQPMDRKRSLAPLTQSRMKLLRNLPRPEEKIFDVEL